MRCPSWIQKLILGVYALICLIAFTIVIVEVVQNRAGPHLVAWITAGVFTMGTLPLMFWLITGHLRYYTEPDLQRYLIRICWMVPIYSVDAWIAIRFPSAAIYMDTIRECYEAFVIYNFMFFLTTYLHKTFQDFDLVLQSKPQTKHLFPFCCLPPWQMGSQIIDYCKHGVLQYAVVRPIATVFALIFQATGIYHEGDFSLTSGWFYIVFINNISQIIALYCLVLFYKATREELSLVNPVWKFGCVKAVVFLAFWQGVAIALLVKIGVIQEKIDKFGYMTRDEVALGLQDWLICIEMFLLAFAFLYAFTYKPFIPPPYTLHRNNNPGLRSALPTLLDISDFTADVGNQLKTVESKIFGWRYGGRRFQNGNSVHTFKNKTREDLDALAEATEVSDQSGDENKALLGRNAHKKNRFANETVRLLSPNEAERQPSAYLELKELHSDSYGARACDSNKAGRSGDVGIEVKKSANVGIEEKRTDVGIERGGIKDIGPENRFFPLDGSGDFEEGGRSALLVESEALIFKNHPLERLESSDA